jgi:hypothetical protein
MPRARKRAARRRRAPAGKRPAAAKRAPATRRVPPPPRAPARPTDAERRLLALAREMEALGADALPRAVRALAGAYAPEGELATAVHRAWLAARDDKTARLALAWAREQLRLGLQDVIEATPPSARGRIPLPAETLAWLVLAACESLVHEPPSAAADRLRLLLELTGGAAPPA